jgi:2-methylaconitate cis-trans-isomerase PrpF
VVLNFLDAAGAKTGKLLPTGHAIDVVDGIEVSMRRLRVAAGAHRRGRAQQDGLRDQGSARGRQTTVRRIEAIRIEAALRMGLGDATGKVLPKVALLAPPARSGSLSRVSDAVDVPCGARRHRALCIAAAARVPAASRRR